MKKWGEPGQAAGPWSGKRPGSWIEIPRKGFLSKRSWGCFHCIWQIPKCKAIWQDLRGLGHCSAFLLYFWKSTKRGFPHGPLRVFVFTQEWSGPLHFRQ